VACFNSSTFRLYEAVSKGQPFFICVYEQ
jgi:hypothetical protein